MKRLLFILPILLLAACQLEREPSSKPKQLPEYALVNDTWRANLAGSEVTVQRHIVLAHELLAFVNGSQAIDSQNIASTLLEAGASQAVCQSRQLFRQLILECDYRLPVDQSKNGEVIIPLPNETLLRSLSEIPQQTARSIHIMERGTYQVPGVLSDLPPTQTKHYPDGSSSSHSFALTSPSTLSVRGEIYLPPGAEGNALAMGPETASFLTEYLARPSAWLAFGVALISILVVLAVIYPVGAHLSLQPKIWNPELTYFPFFLRWPIKLIVRLINWLHQYWPSLLNLSTAFVMIILGIQVLLFAWSISGSYGHTDAMKSIYENLSALIPWVISLDIVLWPGWPIMLAIVGLGSLLTGAGLLARRETARYFIASLGVAIIGGLIYLWPQFLLAPPFTPFQLNIALWLGEMILVIAMLFTRSFTHPQFRIYYTPSGDNR